MGDMFCRILADIETDPLKILDGKLGIETGDKTIWYLMDIPGLYDLLMMVAIMVGVIFMLLAFMHYLVATNKNTKSDIKGDIMQRAEILFLIGMSVTIMDILLLIGKALNGA